MERVADVKYVYTAPKGGKQEFSTEIDRDADSFEGRGLSSKGALITGDVRVAMEHEDAARLASIDAVVAAVQGLIIQLIHAHSWTQR